MKQKLTLLVLILALAFPLAAVGAGPTGSAPSPTHHRVEVYGTSWCPYCRKAREYFHSRGIPFADYDVEKDPAAARRKSRLDSRPGVPLVVIDGKVIYGYDPSRYAAALQGDR